MMVHKTIINDCVTFRKKKSNRIVWKLRNEFYKKKDVAGLRYNLSVLLYLKTIVALQNF